MWRMGRDSNPRYLAVHTLSRRAQSTALAPIRNEPTILVSIHRSCNPFVTPGRFDPRSKRCVDRIGSRNGNVRPLNLGKVYCATRSRTYLPRLPLVWPRARFFQPSAWKPACIPRASRLSERQICHDLWRRDAWELQRGMRRPSDLGPQTNHFSPLTCGGSGDNRSAIAFSSVSSSA